ncbi:PLP-dependent aminotransferase family protein [Saccharothrix sp. SC076]|nr:PLP-dependent aminotransferase family protein [Saccharothrix obliqua]
MPIVIDRHSACPLYLQLADQIERLLGSTAMEAGDQLPSSRVLARELDISRGVVVSAYTELFGRGVLHRRRGAGTFVSTAGRRREPSRAQRARPRAIDMSVGRTNAEQFPKVAWRSAWHEAAYRPPGTASLPVEGLPELRKHVANYLTKARGVRCDWREVLITRGIRHGIELFSRAVLDGRGTVLLDPAAPTSPWRGPGFRVLRLPDTGRVAVDALVAVPGGRCPGVDTMPLGYRRSLLRLAGEQNAHVVEVDHGTELISGRYVPPLKTIDWARVTHVGDFSHLFSDELRLAYLVPPPALRRLIERRMTTEDTADGIAQRAMRTLLVSGEVVRYANLLARTYERKVVRARRRFQGTPLGESAVLFSGANMLVHVDDSADEPDLRALLRGLGIVFSGRDGMTTVHGLGRTLVLGIGHLDDDQLDRATGVLSEVLPSLCRGIAGGVRP